MTFFKLDSRRRNLLLRAVWLCTWYSVRSRFTRLAMLIPQRRECSGTGEGDRIEDIKWVLGALDRHYKPHPSCLLLSLTGAQLLNRYGYLFTVNIGVSKEAGFQAHAWLTSDQQAIWGSNDDQSFTTIGELRPGEIGS